jgi:hypothetical protein
MAHGFKPLINNDLPQLLDFGRVLELFLELRGKGASLSGDDLTYLSKWKQRKVSPQVVEVVMRGLDAECSRQSKPFPTGLKAVDRRVTLYLKNAASEEGERVNL